MRWMMRFSDDTFCFPVPVNIVSMRFHCVAVK